VRPRQRGGSLGRKMGNQLAPILDGCCIGKDDGLIVDLEFPGSAAALSVSEGGDGLNAKEAYYKEWDSIRDALYSQDVVLIRGDWLEEVYRQGNTLPRRQDLPPQAVWPVEELMQRVKDHRQPTPQVLSISYSWLTRDHPDPDGYHLRSFAPLLRHFARHCKITVDSLAIFLDWCSLPQKPRVKVEEVAYQRALRSIDLWYAHWLVEVWLLTRVPDGATPYEDRGWPKFERALATLTSPPESTLDLGLLRGGWKSWGQVANDCQAQRRPPETPENFAADLINKAFSQREDESFVSEKYHEVFERALGQEGQLWYAGLGWGDREAQELAQLLPLCGSTLRDLELRGNEIASSGAAALAEALPLCDALERLSLDGNCIGSQAQQALTDAWQRTGKPRFGLEIGEQNFRPRNATPGILRDVSSGGGSRGDTPPGMKSGRGATPQSTQSGGMLGGGSGSAAASEQLNQLLARQAAFEARIESSVARLTDGLVEVADAVGARQRRPQGLPSPAGGAGTPSALGSAVGPFGSQSPSGFGTAGGGGGGPFPGR